MFQHLIIALSLQKLYPTRQISQINPQTSSFPTSKQQLYSILPFWGYHHLNFNVIISTCCYISNFVDISLGAFQGKCHHFSFPTFLSEYFTVGFYKTVVQKQSFIIKQWCKALGWTCSVLVEILVNGVYILCVFYVQNANCFFFLLIFSIIFMSSFACASWCFYLWDWWDVRLYFCFVIIFFFWPKNGWPLSRFWSQRCSLK